MRERLHPVSACAAALLALAIGIAVAPGATAASVKTEPRVIVVLVDSVSLADATSGELPGFAALSERGSTGFSPLPQGAAGHNGPAYATIGNGSPVPVEAVVPELSNGFEASETVEATLAAAAYARSTGVPTTAGIVNPQIVAFTRALSAGGGPESAGVLGSSLRAAGLTVALIGNADGSGGTNIDRSAMLVAMDAAGTVDTGAVGASVVVTDTSRAMGVRTDFDRVFELTTEALRSSSLVVIETGDLQRARVQGVAATPAAAAQSHRVALADTDGLLQRLAPLADESTLLLVVSPSVPETDAVRGRALAPIWAAGGPFPPGGTLSSSTTRRSGLVTLHDIAPAVLAHLGIQPIRPMAGLGLRGTTVAGAPNSLLATVDRAGALHVQRADAIAAFVLCQTALLIALCIPWLQRRVFRGRWWWVVPYASGALALAVLLAPAFGSLVLAAGLGVVALIALACAAGLAALRGRVQALGVLATATTGALVIDLVFGSPLARWSFLGYDLIVGGRFYGVGNEYEGVLVGASIVGAACLVALAGRHRRLAVGAVGAGCLALIGAFALPGLGADAGGALAAAFGLGVTFYGFAGGRFTWRRLLVLVGVLAAIGIAGIALASALGDSTGSHAGRFLSRLTSGDVGFATELLLGKVRANAYLLGNSEWRSVLLAATAALTVLGLRYRAELRAAYVASPDLARGVPGLIAGGLAVLALNDSGVIALATLAPYAVLLVLTLISVAPSNPADETSP